MSARAKSPAAATRPTPKAWCGFSDPPRACEWVVRVFALGGMYW